MAQNLEMIKRLTFEDINILVALKTRSGNRFDFLLPETLVPGNDKKENWLTCFISAFANSDGGTLFFGIKKVRGRASQICEVDFSLISAFWLETVLQNGITPVIDKLEVYEVPTSENSKKGILVVNVPKSSLRPHMASDNKYHQRIGMRNEIMEETRIRELYNLVSVPEMEFVGIINTNGVPTLENGLFIHMNFYPKFLVRNAGNAVEKIFKFELWLPSDLHDANFSPLQNYFNRLEGPYTVFSVPNRQPVFQGEICNVLEAKLSVNYENMAKYTEGEMKIKLYYSRGIKEFSYLIKETFTYENKYLITTDFVKELI